jgi:large subunit ribosomal protein L23e
MAKQEKGVQLKTEKFPTKPRLHITRGVQTETYLNVIDNSGAKIVKVIGVKGFRGRLNMIPCGCIGDVVVCSVKKGNSEMRKKIVYGIVIRQKKIFKRKDGMNVCFEDNGCCIVTGKGELKGTQISGPVPREVADTWPRIAALASSIE